MTVIQNKVVNAAGGPVVGARVTVRLYTGDTPDGGPPQPGFVPGQQQTLVDMALMTTDAAGLWTIDLIPNSEIIPASSLYQITEEPNAGTVKRYFIQVPPAGGPFFAGDILVDPPTVSFEPSGLQEHLASLNPHPGLIGTFDELSDASKGTAPPVNPALEDLWIDTDDPIVADETEVSTASKGGGVTGTTLAQQLTELAGLVGGVGITVQDENANVLVGATQLDFQGAGVSAVAGTGGEVIVTVAGGGGSASQPGAKTYRTTSFTVPNATLTPIVFDANSTEAWDTDGFHDPATNPSRFTCPIGKAGRYACKGSIVCNGNGTGNRSALVRVNGTTPIFDRDDKTPNASAATTVKVSGEVYLNVGDYVEMCLNQTSTTTLTVSDVATFGNAACWFAMERIGD